MSAPKSLHWTRLILPISLGLFVALWMLFSSVSGRRFIETEPGRGQYSWIDSNQNGIVDFTNEDEFIAAASGNYRALGFSDLLGQLDWTWTSTLLLLAALLMMVIRDVGYIIRIRVLTDKELTWKQAIRVILVWEFASALSPGVVGGAAVAMFILNREGINMGRSTALVMVTAFLDELFYVIIVPIIVLWVGTAQLFPHSFSQQFFGIEMPVKSLFWVGFAVILIITVALYLAIFFTPGGFKRFLVLVCRLPILKRFQEKAAKTGDDLVVTSQELKGKPMLFWLSSFGATALSWTGRYLVINFLLMAFDPGIDHLVAFARQLSMWVILLVSPTPGGSGIAEFAFSGFLEDLIPLGLIGLVAVLWRLISYYPYLFIGAFLVPRWFNSTSEKPKET